MTLIKNEIRNCCQNEHWTHVCGLFVVVYIVHISGETEVGDLHNVVLRHKDISGSQVSVDTLHGKQRTHTLKRHPPHDARLHFRGSVLLCRGGTPCC